jgi:hypothetical protein
LVNATADPINCLLPGTMRRAFAESIEFVLCASRAERASLPERLTAKIRERLAGEYHAL